MNAQFPIVESESGRLRGVARNGIATFLDIPYAAAPIGALRWRPPAPPAGWAGVRDAGALGPACPQKPLLGTAGPMHEDCLSLNVWTSTTDARRRLPVMVWIHAGAFTVGAGSRTVDDGNRFAQGEVVFVSFNYRLGRLGFFAHPALADEASEDPVGNYALLDMIAALKWVRSNISAFGGDPDNVTLFGTAAGGVSINCLMTSPLARGLFHKAIAQSAGFLRPLLTMTEAGFEGPLSRAQADCAWADSLGATDAAALRAIPAAMIAETSPNVAEPMIDGRVLLEDPMAAFANGRQVPIPYIAGFNLRQNLSKGINRAQPQTVFAGLDDLPRIQRLYGPNDPAVIAADLHVDRMFAAPARFRVAKMALGGTASFAYRFSYIPENARGVSEGPGHMEEVPYIFGNLAQQGDDRTHFTPEDMGRARTIHARWIAFARTGAPNIPGACEWPSCPAGEAPSWMDFSVEGDRVHRNFRTEQLAYCDALAAASRGLS